MHGIAGFQPEIAQKDTGLLSSDIYGRFVRLQRHHNFVDVHEVTLFLVPRPYSALDNAVSHRRYLCHFGFSISLSRIKATSHPMV